MTTMRRMAMRSNTMKPTRRFISKHVFCFLVLLGLQPGIGASSVFAQSKSEPKAAPKTGSSLAETTIPAGRLPITGVEIFLTRAGYTVVLPSKLLRDPSFPIEFEETLKGLTLIDLKHVFDKNGFDFYYDDRIEHHPLPKKNPKKRALEPKDSFVGGKTPLSVVRRYVVKRGWIMIMAKDEDQSREVRLFDDDDVTDRDLRNLLRRCGYLAKQPKKKATSRPSRRRAPERKDR